MDFAGYLKQGIEIVKLDGSAATAAGSDKQALVPAFLFVAIGGLSAGIGGLLFGHSGRLIGAPVGALIGFLIFVTILHLVATLIFGGRGELGALLRAEGLASILGWAGVVPVLGALVSLWHLPVSVVVLENVYQMTRGRAIGAVATVVGLFLLLGLLSMILLARLMATG